MNSEFEKIMSGIIGDVEKRMGCVRNRAVVMCAIINATATILTAQIKTSTKESGNE